MMSKSFLIALCTYLLSFAETPVSVDEISHPTFPYNLGQPNAIFEMPESLKEISGLGMTADEASLAAVNDEEGIIFLIDKMNGEITKEIEFWGDGDYEGIEIAGNDAYIVKSNGTIYHVTDYGTDSLRTHKIKSFLNKENDVEGLAFDPAENALLVGCKGKIAEGEEGQSGAKKAIYRFDLAGMVMFNEPAYTLTLPDVQAYLGHLEKDHDNLDKLQDDFSNDRKELKFSPSGIAVHPISKNVYVTSSKGKMLLVLSPAGEILHLQKLGKKKHPQPEGICFGADGTLYIANEGKDDKAKVYKFLYQN